MVHTLWIVMVLQIKTKLLTHFDVAYVRCGFFRYYSLGVVPCGVEPCGVEPCGVEPCGVVPCGVVP